MKEKFVIENNTFTINVNNTSNFDFFLKVNPHLSKEKADEIWNYYRNIGIQTKLMGSELSSYRNNLRNFVSEKLCEGRWIETKKESFEKYIGLARYMCLQYETDSLIESLNGELSVTELTKHANRILGTVKYNNYVSYFSSDRMIEKLDLSLYNKRKLTLKSHYSYNHKNVRWWICESELGAVKIWVSNKHDAFLKTFDTMISDNVTVNVVTSKVESNMDKSTAYIKVENFFLNP